LFDVEELIADEGVRGELLLGLSDEQGRDVGKDIFGLIRGQGGQDEGSSASGSGTDFEDSEGPVVRQTSAGLEDGFLQERVGIAGSRGVLIKGGGGGEIALGKQ
jgi:hypothetical protein